MARRFSFAFAFVFLFLQQTYPTLLFTTSYMSLVGDALSHKAGMDDSCLAGTEADLTSWSKMKTKKRYKRKKQIHRPAPTTCSCSIFCPSAHSFPSAFLFFCNHAPPYRMASRIFLDGYVMWCDVHPFCFGLSEKAKSRASYLPLCLTRVDLTDGLKKELLCTFSKTKKGKEWQRRPSDVWPALCHCVSLHVLAMPLCLLKEAGECG